MLKGAVYFDASEEEITRWCEVLRRCVSRICPPWLAVQREDIVQAALVRLLGILNRSEGSRELGTSYLWKVAYTATIDEIRRLRQRKEVPLEDTEALRTGPSPVDPERAGYSDEIGRNVRDCLQELVRARRLAVTLHLQGHSVPEAARLLGWSPKKVDNLVYRGLADLRLSLARRGMRP